MTPADLLQRLLRRLHGLLCAVLLASACFQALGPIGMPLERTRGSAFSAATEDVAIAPARRAEATQPAAALLPFPRLAITPASAPAIAPLAAPPLVRPRSTGPPPYPHWPPQTGPRAPPLA